MVRERDLLHKEMLKAVSATTKQLSLVKLHEQSKKNLEQEIQNYKEEAQKQRKIIYQLEKERDRYINEASDLTQKVHNFFCFFFFSLFNRWQITDIWKVNVMCQWKYGINP